MTESAQKLKNAQIEFSVVRACALNAYAAFEQSLAMLFSTLLGNPGSPIHLQKSYLVFAQILSYRHRRQMLTELVEISYPKKFDVFLKSLLKKLARLESDRNKIVHWIVFVSSRGGQPSDPYTDIALHEHPNLFDEGRMPIAEMKNFEERAEFFRQLIFYFDFYLKYPEKLAVEDGKTAWPEIFQKPVDYPPRSDHPLFQKHKAQSDQLLS